MITSIEGKVHLQGSWPEVQAGALAIFIALHNQDRLYDVMHTFNTMLADDDPAFHTEPTWQKEWRIEEDDEEDDDEFY